MSLPHRHLGKYLSGYTPDTLYPEQLEAGTRRWIWELLQAHEFLDTCLFMAVCLFIYFLVFRVFFFCFFFFWSQDAAYSSLTKERNFTPCIGSVVSKPLDCQRKSPRVPFKNHLLIPHQCLIHYNSWFLVYVMVAKISASMRPFVFSGALIMTRCPKPSSLRSHLILLLCPHLLGGSNSPRKSKSLSSLSLSLLHPAHPQVSPFSFQRVFSPPASSPPLASTWSTTTAISGLHQCGPLLPASPPSLPTSFSHVARDF